MGHSGEVLPRHADLIPFPFQVRGYLDNLVRIAKSWVFEGQPLPPALRHLLERHPVAGLSAVNERIRRKLATDAFIHRAEPCHRMPLKQVPQGRW